MQTVHRTALLPYPVAPVFDIVADVRSYPEFLPGCRRAVVHDEGSHELLAELELDLQGVRTGFTTRNVLVPYERIELHLVSGPFKSFEGEWRFKRLGEDDGCKVELDLEFALSGARAWLGGAFSGVFARAADRLVDAFCERARQVLG
ncbi:MAG: type II toxin-antitoxin system RatA family toxin [Pseudomonadota bacterium]